MDKILVTYFSATGATKRLAEKIAGILYADIFEIKPEITYTEEDLKWPSRTNRSFMEMRNKRFRPLIKNKLGNVGDYNIVFLGFPVWYNTAPSIINSFIEENNLTGKDVYIFVTSGAHTADKSIRDLQKTYKNINFISAKRFSGRFREKDFLEWVS
ncbi:MAG: flavodoxin [Clostridia bacterium]|nr:flavodoxin [Clostridia bacterium]